MDKIKNLLQSLEHLNATVLAKCEDSAYHDYIVQGRPYIKKVPVSSWLEGTNDFFDSVRISQEQHQKQILLIQRNGNISSEGMVMLQKAKGIIGSIKHVCRLFELRKTFEKYLDKYIKNRNVSEALLVELKTLINTFTGSDLGNIPAKVKTRIKEISGSVEKSIFKTGICFNNMAAWSMLMQPNILGNYSWYSYQKQGKAIPRDPWHQYISIEEVTDISKLAKEALEVIEATMELGIVGEDRNVVSDMERTLMLLTPDVKLNQQGVLEVFPNLSTHLVNNEDDDEEDDSSSVPSMDDLEFLESWMEKSRKNVDMSNDIFHDAVSEAKVHFHDSVGGAKNSIPPPNATSSKVDEDEKLKMKEEKKTEEIQGKMSSWKKELNLHVGSDESEDDRSSNISSSSTVGPGASPEKLIRYAEKKFSSHKKQMNKCSGQESLLTLKSQLKDSIRKLDAFGDPDDNHLQHLYDKLDGLLDTVDTKLDTYKQREVKQRQLPRGKMTKWNGDASSYLDFKNQLSKLLVYDIEELNISTLKDQIIGPDKSHIHSILHNVTDMAEAWRRLDMEFGDILVVLPKLKEELDALPDLPIDEETEKHNIEKIINYCTTAIINGGKDQLGPLFIQTYREKLSKENRKELVAENVLDTDIFIRKLESFKTIALKICRTSKSRSKRRSKLFNNKQIHDGREHKMKCQICSEQHLVFKCPLITQEESSDKIIEALKRKSLCTKCFQKTGPEHKCSIKSKKFTCFKHGYQRCICKCGYKKEADVSGQEEKPQVSSNTKSINCVQLGATGFPTESVVLKYGRKKMFVLITYDSWASHCMLHFSGAEKLGLEVKEMGSMDVSCHTGVVEEAGRLVTAVIVGCKSDFKLDFLITDVIQKLPSYSYYLPSDVVQRYEIEPNPSSPSGENLVTIGQDAVALFPEHLETVGGVALYRSRITGKILFSGKAQKLDQNCGLFSNRAMQMTELQQSITTDSLNISPLAKCIKCTSCQECRKPHKPSRGRQSEHSEVIRSCLTLNDEPDGTQRYTASYPHNNLLQQLPVYELEVKSMMRQLEARLVRFNLADQFNQVVADFLRRGVITVGPQDLEGLQKSFVPLCYSLKADPLASTKLRVCTNGSFKTGTGMISYNDTLISSPEYLNDITGILLRWRAAGSVAIGDIATCYHQIKSTPMERSLRRLWIKPVLGMGSSEDFVEACVNTVSFGESLGGPVAQYAIFDTAQTCMSKQVADDLQDNAFMDDLQVLSYEEGNIDPLVSEVDVALRKRNLAVKEWIKIGSETKKEVKYLNYGWDTMSDSIYLRPRINWSRRRRGAREAPDVQTKEQLDHHIRKYPITKRNLASIVMGTLYDPLGLGQPYNNNLKSLFREVCRMELEWQDQIPQETQQKLVEALEFFLTLNQVMFPRRAMYLEAKLLEFCIFFDGSPTEHCGVSVIVRNVLHDGTEICRLLLTKAKLGGSDILTAPRAELLACLMSTRLYILIKEYLSSFLAAFRGEVVFSINGDSSICLAQIQHDSWKFRMWTATRIEEIKMNTKDMNYKLDFYFVPGEKNFSDFLTRTYWKSPKEYEDFLKSVCVPEERQPVVQERGEDLHDLDVKNIYVRSAQVEAGLDGLDQLPQESVNAELETGGLFLPQWSRMQSFVMYHVFHHQKKADEAKQRADRPHVIKTLLERRSSYFKVQNSIAFMLKWRKKYKKENFLSLQEHAEVLIFQLYQGEATEYVSNFKGNGFSTISDSDGIISVIGRKTYAAPSGIKLRLVPPHNLLYKRITETFHQKYHSIKASPVFIRAQIQRAGYYVPSLLKRLKSLQDQCPLCRRYRKKLMEVSMGTVQMKRLTQSAPFVNMQGDLFGPMKCKSFTNQRTIRKIWGLILICDYSRYISIVPVESLSAVHLMNALKHHTMRFGHFRRLEVDLGTNFTGAKDDIEAVDESEANELAREIQRTGAVLVQRSPKSPFLQGSGEHSVKCVKRILPTKHTLTLAEWFLAFSFSMDLVNKRPIGMSNTMESFSPSSIIPVWSEIEPPATMRGCTEVIQRYKDEFFSNWRMFYMDTVVRQNKWFEDSPHAPLQVNDVVLISDLVGSTGYMTMGRVTGTEADTSGHIRYYKVSYKRGDGTKEKCVTRTGRSLVFIFRSTSENCGQEHTADIMARAVLKDIPVPKQKKKVEVKLSDGAAKIMDK